ncbi:hypothetical protein [Ferruginibacter albus]|uniref:hypothetical protein n=1 Tax=Ferruginibacter albus TaxID=2875540 RepID=UPI001CC48D5F|nr:hypothetical protein [Ferruginibacter albus]UAY52128.1 hypothetical protein K9M53_00190 [Ferruginibacter albus]
MPTANSNRINIVLTPAQIADLRTAFDTIDSIMSFAVGLSVKERTILPKINSSNKTFSEDALQGLESNAPIFPSYLKAADMGNDLTLYTQLDEFVQRSKKTTEVFSDTQMLAGSEAYTTALAVYRLAESAALAGVQGANTLYDHLKERFKGQGGSGDNGTNEGNTPTQQ